ncbi:MAG: YnfA family protein [Saprospiraceae bacterium]|nr:YnfA family protein [Saprospiraceae bacterium]
MPILKSLFYFFLAGLCEIGGGYLVWLWIKEEKAWWYGLLGALIMILYAVVATWQPTGFGRTYATYGGIFVIMSVLWSWKVDQVAPDKYDIVGALIILIGITVIMYSPRK